MRKLQVATVMVFVLGIGSVACAERPHHTGQISKSELAAMGLANLSAMDDAEGHEIRGRAFVFVNSIAFALGDADFNAPKTSSGAPRFQSSKASNTVFFPGGSYSTSSKGFAFAFAN